MSKVSTGPKILNRIVVGCTKKLRYLSKKKFILNYRMSFFNLLQICTFWHIKVINVGDVQGVIISPIAYPVYYLCYWPTNNFLYTSSWLYVDDKAIISVNNNSPTDSRNLQNHFDSMENWLTKCRFIVNQNKSIHTTQYITFTLRLT